MMISLLVTYLMNTFSKMFRKKESINTDIVLKSRQEIFCESHDFQILFKDSNFEKEDEYFSYFLNQYRLTKVYQLYDHFAQYSLPLIIKNKLKNKNNIIINTRSALSFKSYNLWPFPAGTAYPPLM